MLSVVLAVLTHPWTWSYFLPTYWLYIVAIVAVFLLNKVRQFGTQTRSMHASTHKDKNM